MPARTTMTVGVGVDQAALEHLGVNNVGDARLELWFSIRGPVTNSDERLVVPVSCGVQE